MPDGLQTPPQTHTHAHTQFPPCYCHTPTSGHEPPPPLPQQPLTLMSYLLTVHVHHVLPLILYWLSHFYFCLPCSWSSRLVMSLISLRGSTAPSRTMWRQRGVSRADTSFACLPPPVTSSRSRGTKVRASRVKSGWRVCGLPHVASYFLL